MENFFSALATVCRKIFSAFTVKVLACINVILYGFGDVGVLGCESVGLGGVGGVAVKSFGDAGRLGQFVRDNEAVDDTEIFEATVASDIELIELLLRERLNVVGLNNDRAGDVVIE